MDNYKKERYGRMIMHLQLGRMLLGRLKEDIKNVEAAANVKIDLLTTPVNSAEYSAAVIVEGYESNLYCAKYMLLSTEEEVNNESFIVTAVKATKGWLRRLVS